MRRAAFPLSIVGLGLLVFGAWMHTAVLRPTNVGWLLSGDDRGVSAIGLMAYLRAGGPWPSTHEPLLLAPEGLTLLFTDSIPILGLLFKPFAGLLPPIQLIGLWYLACTLLHAGFAAALVRRHAPDALATWLGAALLTLFPALLNRFGHASLCAQWLILWALWVYVDPRRSAQPGWWTAVLGVAALVHSYLLLMVAGIWASALLPRLCYGPARGRVVRDMGLVALAVMPLVALHGVLGGHYASTGLYGAFPAALDAWWNPANPDYTALLPSSAQDRGLGFEGLQYLGAGLLALTALAVGALATRRVRGTGLRRLAWLLPCFFGLAVVAIGPQPLLWGRPLATLHLPRALIDALDPVRAGGRLMWPATYTLAYLAVIVACRLPRATLLLGGALALQVVDLMPMLAAVRATSARAEDPRRFTRTTDPRWPALVGQASGVEFEPAEPFRDLPVMEEIAWRAVVACRPVRYFYASREARATRVRIDADSRAFTAGLLDPTRLYVLLGRATPPASVANRVRVIDGIALIPPTAPAEPTLCGRG